ncbi:MAG: hypothetical protein IJQ39_04615 [Thermoguttaceae bacterium]|nr:hypothetical protein [Thermoguttaceae bacterium]
MNLTIEDKEQIKVLFTLIYNNIDRAKHLAGAMENRPMHESEVKSWSKEIRESIESGERYVDKLKQCLMSNNNA